MVGDEVFGVGFGGVRGGLDG